MEKIHAIEESIFLVKRKVEAKVPGVQYRLVALSFRLYEEVKNAKRSQDGTIWEEEKEARIQVSVLGF